MKKGLKVVATFTLLCFMTTQCVSAFPGATIEMAGGRELPFYQSMDIPEELGTVDALYEAPAGANPQFILHIQNAHANYQAQMKIKELLGYMNKKYGFKTIFVEGASEKLDADYLRLFPDQERNLKLCDELAKQGELTGAELFLMEQGTDQRSQTPDKKTPHLSSPLGRGIKGEGKSLQSQVSSLKSGAEGAVEALGIEEASLYRANYDALKKVFGAEADVTRFFKGFDGKLDKAASKTFTPETRELIADWKRFEQGRREFMPFVKSLAVKSRKILKVDLESLFAQVGWPQITRLLVIQMMEKDLNKAKGIEEQAALLKMLRTKGVSKELLTTLENFKEGSITVGKSATEVSPREVLERLASEAGPNTDQSKRSGDWGRPDYPQSGENKSQGGPKGFKFSDYPAFSLYAGYVTLRSELDPKVLFEEIEYLFTQMLDTLAQEPEQKALLTLYRDGELLRKLLHLELNRAQWRQVLEAKDRIAVPSLVSRLKDAVQTADLRSQTADKKPLHLSSPSGSGIKGEGKSLQSPVSGLQSVGDVMPPKFAKTMDGLFAAGLEFYDFAHKREAVFYKEMQAAMAERKISKAVLITGGFHTDGMSDLFRENAVSYGIVTPRLSEKSDENLYRKVMLQKNNGVFDLSYLEATSRMIRYSAQFAQLGRIDVSEIFQIFMADVGITDPAVAVDLYKKTLAYTKLRESNFDIAQKTDADGNIVNDAQGKPLFEIVRLQAAAEQSLTIGGVLAVKTGPIPSAGRSEMRDAFQTNFRPIDEIERALDKAPDKEGNPINIRDVIKGHITRKGDEGVVNIADVGCGLGVMLRELKDEFRVKINPVGVDRVDWNEEGKKDDYRGDLKRAKALYDAKVWDDMKLEDKYRQLFSMAGVEFIKSDMEEVEFSKPMDVITSFYALQYSENPLKVIENLFNQLAPSGIAILHLLVPSNKQEIAELYEALSRRLSANSIEMKIYKYLWDSGDQSLFFTLKRGGDEKIVMEFVERQPETIRMGTGDNGTAFDIQAVRYVDVKVKVEGDRKITLAVELPLRGRTEAAQRRSEARGKPELVFKKGRQWIPVALFAAGVAAGVALPSIMRQVERGLVPPAGFTTIIKDGTKISPGGEPYKMQGNTYVKSFALSGNGILVEPGVEFLLELNGTFGPGVIEVIGYYTRDGENRTLILIPNTKKVALSPSDWYPWSPRPAALFTYPIDELPPDGVVLTGIKITINGPRPEPGQLEFEIKSPPKPKPKPGANAVVGQTEPGGSQLPSVPVVVAGAQLPFARSEARGQLELDFRDPNEMRREELAKIIPQLEAERQSAQDESRRNDNLYDNSGGRNQTYKNRSEEYDRKATELAGKIKAAEKELAQLPPARSEARGDQLAAVGPQIREEAVKVRAGAVEVTAADLKNGTYETNGGTVISLGAVGNKEEVVAGQKRTNVLVVDLDALLNGTIPKVEALITWALFFAFKGHPRAKEYQKLFAEINDLKAQGDVKAADQKKEELSRFFEEIGFRDILLPGFILSRRLPIVVPDEKQRQRIIDMVMNFFVIPDPQVLRAKVDALQKAMPETSRYSEEKEGALDKMFEEFKANRSFAFPSAAFFDPETKRVMSDSKVARRLAEEILDIRVATADGIEVHGVSGEYYFSVLKWRINQPAVVKAVRIIQDSVNEIFKKLHNLLRWRWLETLNFNWLNSDSGDLHIRYEQGSKRYVITEGKSELVIGQDVFKQQKESVPKWPTSWQEQLTDQLKKLDGIMRPINFGTGDQTDESGAQDNTNLGFTRNGELLLVDPSVRTLRNLEEMGLMGKVNTITLTHCHYDHDGGILELLRRQNTGSGLPKLKLIASAPVYAQFQMLATSMFGPDVDASKLLSDAFDWQLPVRVDGLIAEYHFGGGFSDVIVQTLRTFGHPVPTFGLKMIDLKTGASVAYLPDSRMPNPTLKDAEGKDIPNPRYQEMIDFYGTATYLISENGVPGVHITPADLLRAFPEHVKRGTLFTVHSAGPQTVEGLERFLPFMVLEVKTEAERWEEIRKVEAILAEVFPFLSKEAGKDLAVRVRPVNFEPGKIILEQGRPVEDTPFVFIHPEKGKYDVLVDGVVVATRVPPGLVGEMGIITKKLTEKKYRELKAKVGEKLLKRFVVEVKNAAGETFYAWNDKTIHEIGEIADEKSKKALTDALASSGPLGFRTATVQVTDEECSMLAISFEAFMDFLKKHPSLMEWAVETTGNRSLADQVEEAKKREEALAAEAAEYEKYGMFIPSPQEDLSRAAAEPEGPPKALKPGRLGEDAGVIPPTFAPVFAPAQGSPARSEAREVPAGVMDEAGVQNLAQQINNDLAKLTGMKPVARAEARALVISTPGKGDVVVSNPARVRMADKNFEITHWDSTRSEMRTDTMPFVLKFKVPSDRPQITLDEYLAMVSISETIQTIPEAQVQTLKETSFIALRKMGITKFENLSPQMVVAVAVTYGIVSNEKGNFKAIAPLLIQMASLIDASGLAGIVKALQRAVPAGTKIPITTELGNAVMILEDLNDPEAIIAAIKFNVLLHPNVAQYVFVRDTGASVAVATALKNIKQWLAAIDHKAMVRIHPASKAGTRAQESEVIAFLQRIRGNYVVTGTELALDGLTFASESKIQVADGVWSKKNNRPIVMDITSRAAQVNADSLKKQALDLGLFVKNGQFMINADSILKLQNLQVLYEAFQTIQAAA